MDEKDEETPQATPPAAGPPAVTPPPRVPVPRKSMTGMTIALIIVSAIAVFFLLTTLLLGGVVFMQGIRLHQGRYGYDRNGGYDGSGVGDCCDCPMRDRGYERNWQWEQDDTNIGPPPLPQLPPGPGQSAPVPTPGR
ncbi:MAG: hypothetical protein KKF41_11210 [Actinobacteria bacterium]|nr:hypothetical protein [Actinomycetota bacterium]MBU1944931.1 hypothetical protein [Actinomycetota bacterium]MBU2688143.1 hypothetical protein [Actinomycetota bacterium]